MISGAQRRWARALKNIRELTFWHAVCSITPRVFASLNQAPFGGISHVATRLALFDYRPGGRLVGVHYYRRRHDRVRADFLLPVHRAGRDLCDRRPASRLTTRHCLTAPPAPILTNNPPPPSVGSCLYCDPQRTPLL